MATHSLLRYSLLGFILICFTTRFIKADEDTVVYFSTDLIDVGEMEPYIDVIIRRTGNLLEPCIFVMYTEPGTATSPFDYAEISQELAFVPGQDLLTTWISVVNDYEKEAPEYFTVHLTLSDQDPDVIFGDPSEVEVTIWDGDIYGSSYGSAPLCEDQTLCKNGGTCYSYIEGLDDVIVTGDTFTCACTDYWTGEICEDASPCYIDEVPQCHNEAPCIINSPTEYTCKCPQWYTGDNCQNAPPLGLEPLVAFILTGSLFMMIVLVGIICCCCCCKSSCCKRNRSNRHHANDMELQNPKKWPDYEPKLGISKQNSYLIGPLPGSEAAHLGGKFEFPRDRLELHERIGEGAFAAVYRAQAIGIVSKTTSTKVAVKMLKVGASETDRSDFVKELSLYKSLEPHKNIITLLGCCTDKAPMYLILEFAHNGSLHSHISKIRSSDGDYLVPGEKSPREKSLSQNEILSFASQIANGMEYLASKNCVHRDLAARNVLLGDGMVCKLSDFGLARDMENEQQYEMRSKGRVPVRWLAIESLLQNIYTVQSDVWSFGVVLWELVTLGSHPYPGIASREIITQLIQGFRLPKPKHCSDDIYKMMQNCWKAEPKDRPTFTSLRDQLENMLADDQDYLMMLDFNEEAYVYLEPHQRSQSTEISADQGIDNAGFTSQGDINARENDDQCDAGDAEQSSEKESIQENQTVDFETIEERIDVADVALKATGKTVKTVDGDVPIEQKRQSETPKKRPPLPRQPSVWF